MRTYETARPYGKEVTIGDEPRPTPPADPFLVSGLITRALTLIYGEPGCGKTTFSVALTVASSNGDPEFLGQEFLTDGPIRVGIISGDPVEDERYEQMLQGMVPAGMVRIYPIHRPPEGDIEWETLAVDLKGRDTGLVIVDNLEAFVEDTTNAVQLKAFLGRLIRFIRMGMPVVLIHHSSNTRHEGRRSTRPLGLTAIQGTARWYAFLALDNTGPLHISLSGKWGPAWELSTSRPDGTGKLVKVDAVAPDELTAKREKSKRQRDEATKAKRGAIGDYVMDECQGLNGATAAKKIAEAFGGKASTHAVALSRGEYGVKGEQGTWARLPDQAERVS